MSSRKIRNKNATPRIRFRVASQRHKYGPHNNAPTDDVFTVSPYDKVIFKKL